MFFHYQHSTTQIDCWFSSRKYYTSRWPKHCFLELIEPMMEYCISLWCRLIILKYLQHSSLQSTHTAVASPTFLSLGHRSNLQSRWIDSIPFDGGTYVTFLCRCQTVRGDKKNSRNKYAMRRCTKLVNKISCRALWKNPTTTDSKYVGTFSQVETRCDWSLFALNGIVDRKSGVNVFVALLRRCCGSGVTAYYNWGCERNNRTQWTYYCRFC